MIRLAGTHRKRHIAPRMGSAMADPPATTARLLKLPSLRRAAVRRTRFLVGGGEIEADGENRH